MKSSSRFIFLGVVASMLTLGLAGCSQPKAQPKTTEVTVVLDYTPNTNHTGLYVAQQKKYYQKHHLKVKIVQPPQSGADGLVAAGKAEFGVSYQDTMAPEMSGSKKMPITAIAALVQHNTSGIMSRQADDITSPKAMTDKRYATWNLPIEQAIIKTLVNQDGGDYKKVQLMPSNATDEVAALKSQKVDDIWVYYAWGGINAKIQNYPVNYFALKDLNPTFDYYTPVLIGNNDYLKKHPKIAKEFLAATAEGYQYAIKHPKPAAKILEQKVPEFKGKQAKLVDASQEWISGQYQAEVKQWGYMAPKRWNRFYQWLNQEKLVQPAIKKGAGFTNQYLPK
ncbi:ABC transporter substrate-binding protein [Loigolactobacillus zhaoyuanensis]|uniref:ABC transporter substrate-binding protein n=1 Tax=Loigolactobacillus zhaoyuanensis TaxID=2486017 RepID=A0ABW8UHW3_9LACO|nr:ABC transporter substrate-binding protein [Loigolactobacillus zhaoyuanensis]